MAELVEVGPHRLHYGDSLSVLRELPDASVDAVITDPPYSSGGAFRGDRLVSTSDKYSGWSQNADGSSRKPTAEYPEFTGDTRDQRGYLAWCSLWLSDCHRIAKPGAVLMMFTDWRQLPTTTDAIQAGNWIWRGIVVWDKCVGRPVRGRFRNHVEYVCWGTKGPMIEREPAVYPPSVYRITPPTSSKRQHRTEKPTELVTALMEIVAAGGAVLDPFMGSGTTGVACVQTDRPFVGCEIDPDYFQTATSRLREANEPPPLFKEGA